jgi:hypothetical protein
MQSPLVESWRSHLFDEGLDPLNCADFKAWLTPPPDKVPNDAPVARQSTFTLTGSQNISQKKDGGQTQHDLSISKNISHLHEACIAIEALTKQRCYNSPKKTLPIQKKKTKVKKNEGGPVLFIIPR